VQQKTPQMINEQHKRQ